MKVIKTLLAIGVMTTSFAPYAEVGLNFHKELSPVVIEGEEIGFNVFAKSNYILENGTNQVVFRMAKLIEGSGEREKFNSHAFILTFTAEDTELELKPLKRVLRSNDAEEFNRNPSVALIDDSGKRLDFTLDMLPPENTITRDYEAELANYNVANGITVASPVLATSDVAVTVAEPQVKFITVDSGEVGPVSMIQYWLEKASSAETEQFTAWAFENRAIKSPSALAGSKAVEMLSYWYGEAELEQRKQILAWIISQ